MDVNFLAILFSAILAMVVGAIWYGPLFQKRWLEVIGASQLDLEARKKMQSEAGKLYFIQFLLVLFQVGAIHYLTGYISIHYAFSLTLLFWLVFVMPTIAGTCMWNNDSTRTAWSRFFIQSGYQLVIFAIFGIILQFWS